MKTISGDTNGFQTLLHKIYNRHHPPVAHEECANFINNAAWGGPQEALQTSKRVFSVHLDRPHDGSWSNTHTKVNRSYRGRFCNISNHFFCNNPEHPLRNTNLWTFFYFFWMFQSNSLNENWQLQRRHFGFRQIPRRMIERFCRLHNTATVKTLFQTLKEAKMNKTRSSPKWR